MYYYELEKLGINVGGTNRTGNVKVKCPVCEQRKGGTTQKDLSVNVTEGLYRCHNSNCDFRGRTRTTEYSKPEAYVNSTTLPTKIVKYMEGRGISQSTLKKMKVGVSKKGSLTFNYFRNGELINTKERWTTKDGKKAFGQHVGSEKIIYNLDSLEGKTKCIFVEGEIDVLSWIEAGVGSEYAVVSVDMGAPAPGQSPGAKLDCLTNCAVELDGIKEFYLALDKDAPGQYLEQILIKRFGEYRCKRVEFPEGAKDTNDVLTTKGYDTSVNGQTLKMQLSKAKSIPVPGIHVLDDYRDSMMDGFLNGKRKGATTHFPNIDDCFTFMPGDLTCVTGIPGHGKGQLTRQLAIVKAKIDGWKWAVFAPEDFPADDFWDDIIWTYIGKSTDKGGSQMTKEEYKRGMDFANEHFFLVHPETDHETGKTELADNEWINKQFRFLRLKHGCNAYIKDPWNNIFHHFKAGQREDQYLAGELSRERFVAKMYDAAFYIAHPTKMPKRKDGGYERPHLGDVSGGAMWYNMSDNGLTIHRPNIHENSDDKVTEFRSTKIKKQKRVGKPGYANLWFDTNKNRYYQMGNDYSPLEDPKLTGEAIEETPIDNTPQFDPDGGDLPF